MNGKSIDIFTTAIIADAMKKRIVKYTQYSIGSNEFSSKLTSERTAPAPK
jgi:hypothetical protein